MPFLQRLGHGKGKMNLEHSFCQKLRKHLPKKKTTKQQQQQNMDRNTSEEHRSQTERAPICQN